MRKILYALILTSPLIAIARDINLSWDAPTDMSGIASYELGYGLTPGNYTNVLDIPLPNLNFTITGLEDTQNYYFAVRSKSTTSGYEQYSQYSNEAFSLVSPTPTPTPTPSPQTNIAQSGVGYKWANMASITANTNKSIAPELNDLAFDDINLNGNSSSAVYVAGGIIWTTAQNISSVNFTNGSWDYTGDGSFSASLQLQTTTDGATWTNSNWTVLPVYTYDADTANVKYTFTGSQISALGIRVIGQVHTTTQASYWVNMQEIEAYSASTPPIIAPPTGLHLVP